MFEGEEATLQGQFPLNPAEADKDIFVIPVGQPKTSHSLIPYPSELTDQETYGHTVDI